MTHKESFLKKHGRHPTESLSLYEISDLSGFPLSALRQVYQKGLGAYHSNPQSVRLKGSFKKVPKAPLSQKLSPQHWAMARVYAFVDKEPKVFRGADKHIAESFGLL